MNKKLVIFVPIGCLIIGYLLGIFSPYFYLPEIDYEQSMTQADYIKVYIRAIAAFVTFLAILVALFKEDIRNLWDNVQLRIELSQNIIQEELEQMSLGGKSDDESILKAKSYYCPITISNQGNKPAKGSQIYIEKIIFSDQSNGNKTELEVVGKPSEWEHESEFTTMIPPSGRRKCNILFIESPKRESMPDGSGLDVNKVEFKIGETKIDEPYHKGKITVHLAVYSESCKAKKFKLIINWNGKWHNRLAEMSNCLTIELI